MARATRDHELPLSTIIADGTVDGVAAADAERAHTCVAAIAELHTLAQREDVRDVFFAALWVDQRATGLGHFADLGGLNTRVDEAVDHAWAIAAGDEQGATGNQT